MQSLFQDIGFGFRLLSKNRTLTLITILAMAMGIAGSSAMFTLVNSIFLRPLPFERSEKIVEVFETNPRLMIDRSEVTGPDFLEWRKQNTVFEHIAAVQVIGFSLAGIDEPEQISGAKVSPAFFSVMGLKPIAGRDFRPEEEQVAASKEIILSSQLWRRRFNLNANVIGTSITVSGEPFTIIGVMPADPHFPPGVELWTPLALDNEVTENKDHHFLKVFGRLKDGVSIAQAEAEMVTLAKRLEQLEPITNGGVGVNILSLHDALIGATKFDLLVLFCAALSVLLIACASMGNILLARAAAREREMAIRAALGASRRRLVRQLLTESLLLTSLGGILGLILAYAGSAAFKTIINAEVSSVIKVGIDWKVLAFTFTLSVLTGIVFGAAPALRLSRPQLSSALKQDRGLVAAGFRIFRRRNGRSILVVSELALALILLIAAGLLLKSFVTLKKVEPGFNSTNVLSMWIYLPFAKYPEANQITNFFEQALQNIATVPGVESAAVISTPPLGGVNHTTRFQIEGREEATGQGYEASLHRISLDYFKTMGIPLKSGRTFTSSDIHAMPVVVISETMAHRFWPGENPVGKRVKPVLVGMPDLPWISIIGVVGDVRHWGLNSPAQAEAYALFEHSTRPLMSLVVRTQSDPLSALPAISAKIHELDSSLPVQRPRTMDALLSDSVSQPRKYMTLIGTFAIVGLLLAAMGVYGIMSYLVTQRTHEIGVRMALGAKRSDVRRLIMGQALLLSLTGVVIGLAGAFVLSRLMTNLLYGIDSLDVSTFITIPLVLIGVTTIASYLPARRATRIAPTTALRFE